MVAATGGGRRRPTRRIERAMDGAIATYLHELTEHGRPPEDADGTLADDIAPASSPAARADAAPVSGDGLDMV